MSLRDGCTFQTELGSATSDWVLLRNASRCGQSTSKGNYDQPKTQKFHVKLCWIEDGPSRPRQALFNFGHVGAYRLLVSQQFCRNINVANRPRKAIMISQKTQNFHVKLCWIEDGPSRPRQALFNFGHVGAYHLLVSPQFHTNIIMANRPRKAIMISQRHRNFMSNCAGSKMAHADRDKLCLTSGTLEPSACW